MPTNLDASDIAGIDDADDADNSHFDISKDGVLTFDIGDDAAPDDKSVSPDFEAPRAEAFNSADNNNTYKVVVTAADAAADVTDRKVGYHKVTVKVTNEAETGEVTWTVDPDGSSGTITTGVLDTDGTPIIQFQVGATLVASATDGDIEGSEKAVVPSPTWRWYRGSSLISDAETESYTVTTADEGRRLRATATYRVGDSTTQETASLTSDDPVLAVRVGDNKLKFDPDTLNRSVAEGKKGADVGAPVTATDSHGAVNYTLAGDAGDNSKFKIDQKTGQITTDVDLNYDMVDANNCRDEDFCTVTVRATDATGAATAQQATTNVFVDATVTIKVTDVNEKPKFTEDTTAMSPKAITREEGNTSLFEDGAAAPQAQTAADVSYMATDPEELNVNLTLMGTDGAKFSLSSDGELSFRAKPDYEMPADANRDNVYEVTVRASDGTLNTDQMVKVTVTNVDEAPEIIAGGLAISGQSSVSHPEDSTTTTVGTYTARGENPAGARWTLEGADRGDFSLSTSRGESVMLRFSSSPDYERPADADTDNVYMVTLKATEGTNTDTHDVTVRVTDVVEDVPVTDDTLLERYDTDNNGLDKSEVLKAINDYLFGVGDAAISKTEVLELINSYLFG